MAEWMIDHGSDVHQGGEGPLMRAALFGHRIPMMELLVSRGAHAPWNGYFPIIFAPCETVEPAALKWLLDHGADPDCPRPRPKYAGTALDYVIGTYGRSPGLGACMDALLDASGTWPPNTAMSRLQECFSTAGPTSMRGRHSIIMASVGKLPSFTPLRSSMTRGCP